MWSTAWRDTAALAGEDEQLRSRHIHEMLAAHVWTPLRCDYFRLCYLVRHGSFYSDTARSLLETGGFRPQLHPQL